MHWSYYPVLAVAAAHLAWQTTAVDIDDSADCLTKFKSNRDFGLLVFAAALAGSVLR
ncbi:MAG: hypothetical protein ABT940_12180 [Alphaproteobacteria bacterium]